MVLDIAGENASAGAGVNMYPQKPTNNDNQLWSFTSDGFIKSKLNGMVLDIAGENASAGAGVNMYPQKPTNNDNQLWERVPAP